MLFEQRSRLQTLTVRRQTVLRKLEAVNSEMSATDNCQFCQFLIFTTFLSLFYSSANCHMLSYNGK